MPLHSAPHDAVAEIDALYDVYLAIINKWGTDVSVTRTEGHQGWALSLRDCLTHTGTLL